jgi:hypothetical protein
MSSNAKVSYSLECRVGNLSKLQIMVNPFQLSYAQRNNEDETFPQLETALSAD